MRKRGEEKEKEDVQRERRRGEKIVIRGSGRWFMGVHGLKAHVNLVEN